MKWCLPFFIQTYSFSVIFYVQYGKTILISEQRFLRVTLNTFLTLSNRYSENSNLSLKFYVGLCIAIWKSYAKNEENLFFNFLFIKCFLNQILTVLFKFCARLRNVFEKSYAKVEENLSMKFRFMQTFPRKPPRNLLDAKIPVGLKGLNLNKFWV